MQVKELKNILKNFNDDAYVVAIKKEENPVLGDGSEIERIYGIDYDTKEPEESYVFLQY